MWEHLNTTWARLYMTRVRLHYARASLHAEQARNKHLCTCFVPIVHACTPLHCMRSLPTPRTHSLCAEQARNKYSAYSSRACCALTCIRTASTKNRHEQVPCVPISYLPLLEVQTGACTCATFLLTVLGSSEFAETRETFASPQPLGIEGFICLFLGFASAFLCCIVPKPQCSISTVRFRVLSLSLCVFSLRLR
jgi:hypothetical protein